MKELRECIYTCFKVCVQVYKYCFSSEKDTFFSTQNVYGFVINTNDNRFPCETVLSLSLRASWLRILEQTIICLLL
jgi:hypothetical protein